MIWPLYRSIAPANQGIVALQQRKQPPMLRFNTMMRLPNDFDLIQATRWATFLNYGCERAAGLPKNLVERRWEVLGSPTSS